MELPVNYKLNKDILHTKIYGIVMCYTMTMKLFNHFPKNTSRKKKFFFISSLFLLILIISSASLEFFSILLIKNMGYAWEPTYLRIIKGYKTSNLFGGRIEDNSWGQWNVPNYKGRVANNCFNVEYKFNSYGARDKNRSISGKDRTLVFGDSFIEGWGVDQDKTIPAFLEENSGKEFLNFGISDGFSVLNEYLLYKDFASKFQHDAVIVGLTVGNDFTDNDPSSWGGLVNVYYRPFWKLSSDKKDVNIVYFIPRVKGKYVPSLDPKNNSSDSKTPLNLKTFSAFLMASEFIQDHKIYFSKDSALSRKSTYDLDFSEDDIIATRLIYEKFSKLIGEKKKYVVLLPSAIDVYHYLNSKNHVYTRFEQFKKDLNSQGWYVIDAINAFSSVPEKEIPKYFICDGHWSAKGNQLAAQYISKFIK